MILQPDLWVRDNNFRRNGDYIELKPALIAQPGDNLLPGRGSTVVDLDLRRLQSLPIVYQVVEFVAGKLPGVNYSPGAIIGPRQFIPW